MISIQRYEHHDFQYFCIHFYICHGREIRMFEWYDCGRLRLDFRTTPMTRNISGSIKKIITVQDRLHVYSLTERRFKLKLEKIGMD